VNLTKLTSKTVNALWLTTQNIIQHVWYTILSISTHSICNYNWVATKQWRSWLQTSRQQFRKLAAHADSIPTTKTEHNTLKDNTQNINVNK